MNILFFLCIIYINIYLSSSFSFFPERRKNVNVVRSDPNIVPNMCLDFVIYNDFYLLSSIVPLVQKYVAEIVIVDGPYKAMIPLLKRTSLFYDETTIPLKLKETINAWRKEGLEVKYIYKEWESEYEKRAAGYDACSSEIVFSIDGDELVEFKEKELHTFLNDTEKAVACGATANLLRKNLMFGTVPEGGLPNKCILFKKKQISTLHHFAYLWLVGFPDDKLQVKKQHLMSINVARIDHYSILRPHHSMLTKLIFYLWLGKMEDQLDSVIDSTTGYAMMRANFEYTFCTPRSEVTPLDPKFQLPLLESANVTKCKFGMHTKHLVLSATRGGYVIIPTTVEQCVVDFIIEFQDPVICKVYIIARNSTDVYSIGSITVDGITGEYSFYAQTGIYVYAAHATCKLKTQDNGNITNTNTNTNTIVNTNTSTSTSTNTNANKAEESLIIVRHVSTSNPKRSECVESPTLHTMWD